MFCKQGLFACEPREAEDSGRRTVPYVESYKVMWVIKGCVRVYRVLLQDQVSKHETSVYNKMKYMFCSARLHLVNAM